MFRNALSVPRRMFSSTPVSRTDALADLARITASPSSSAASSSFLPLTSTAVSSTESAARGYAVGSMPVKADPVLDLFTNLIMKHGKKAEAQRHVSNILTLLQRATNSPPVPLFHKAIELSSPQVRLLSMKKSAKTVQSPRALNERQRTRTGIQWLLKAAERGRKGGIRRDDRVAREVLAVIEGTSDVFKKLEEVHKASMLQRCVLLLIRETRVNGCTRSSPGSLPFRVRAVTDETVPTSTPGRRASRQYAYHLTWAVYPRRKWKPGKGSLGRGQRQSTAGKQFR
jgi:small subunit ribosomal protein S7